MDCSSSFQTLYVHRIRSLLEMTPSLRMLLEVNGITANEDFSQVVILASSSNWSEEIR